MKPRNKTPKHALGGEPIASFVARGPGASGCWLCDSQKNANAVQRMIGSYAIRAGLRADYMTMIAIRNVRQQTGAAKGEPASLVFFVVVTLQSGD